MPDTAEQAARKVLLVIRAELDQINLRKGLNQFQREPTITRAEIHREMRRLEPKVARVLRKAGLA